MKKLLVIPLLILLTGCVTYYQPETALEDSVYYAQDDPKYVVYQDPYADGFYYPWISLDYFYLGFNPYPRYPYFYGFPFGLVYDYAYWDYAYWYYPYRGYSPWGSYYGHCSHDRVCGGWNGYGTPGHRGNRHAGNAHVSNRNRNDEEIDNEESPADSPDRPLYSGSVYRAPYGRYVSTAPSGYSGNRGMVIRSNESKKVGKSRVQPGGVTSTSNGIVIAAPPSQTTVVSGNSAIGVPSAPMTSAPALPSRPSSPSVSNPPSVSRPGSPSMSSNQVRSSPRSSGPRSSSPRSSNHGGAKNRNPRNEGHN